MSFISLDFLVFCTVITGIYYILPLKLRPGWLLIGSIAFYVIADARYVPFLAFSIISCWWAGLRLAGLSGGRKKLLLALLILMNLGLLCLTKYMYFASDIITRLSGISINLPSFIIPLGISFYTLQAIGYLMDVNRGKIEPEQKLWRFALFMSYFPIILQGPISRYSQLALQLYEGHRFELRKIQFGLQLMLWGFFKKMVIADRAAIIVREVFGNYTEYSGLVVLFALCLYPLHLYADFSGCVDISRGCAQLVGVELAENFRRPFFSQSIQELWRRWHLSLSSWFRDYLYIPLGGSRKGEWRKYLNLIIVFSVSGLWHGAGLNYLLWGFMQGVYLVCGALWSKYLVPRLSGLSRLPHGLGVALRILFCYVLNVFSWLFVRASGMRAGLAMVLSIFRGPWLSQLSDGSLLKLGLDGAELIVLGLSLLLLLAVSYLQERDNKPRAVRERVAALPLPLRWALYLGALLAVLVFGIYGPGYSSAGFIYMNF